MKKLAYLAVNLFFVTVVFGQAEKKDIIFKTNGDELAGDVKEIGDSVVQFVYAGEKLVYKFKKSEILKITFASGRVEKFNATATSTPASPTAAIGQPTSTKEERHNKVAILPFSYISEIDAATDQIGMRIQDECRNYMLKHAGLFTYVENRLIDSRLAKAGITRDNILNYSINELCSMLGAEYIIDGMVNITKAAQTTHVSQSASGTVKEKDKDKSGGDKKYSAQSTSSSTTTQDYATQVTLKIYNDKGETVFSENRKPFLGTGKNAYKSAMEYLLKRTPLYQK